MALLTYLVVLTVFAQVILTFIVLLKMRSVRYAAYKRGDVQMAEISVNHQAWPEEVRQVQNNYINQFELPVLFYMAAALVLIFGLESWIFVLLGLGFVVSRYIHAYIHTGTNHIPTRFKAFLAGFICVVLQWVYLFIMITYAFIITM